MLVPVVLFVTVVALALGCTVNVFRSIRVEEETEIDCCSDGCPCGHNEPEKGHDDGSGNADSADENESLV